MQRFTITVSIIFLLSVAAVLAVPQTVTAATCIGIYADDTHSLCSVYPVPYQLANFWVWVLPGEEGMMCAEYEIAVPTNVIQAATIVNPEAGYSIGDAIVPPGATICFPACRTDWTWTHQITCLVIDMNPSVISLVSHEDLGIMRATSCVESGDPYETMTKLNDVFINQECYMGSETSSWGAIKSILR